MTSGPTLFFDFTGYHKLYTFFANLSLSVVLNCLGKSFETRLSVVGTRYNGTYQSGSSAKEESV